MSRDVWAVSSGEYDDWRVECLFETEDDARAAAAAGVGDRVESYPFRLYGPVEMPRRATTYGAHATVTTDPEYATQHNWRPDQAPYAIQADDRWTHLEPGAVEMRVSHGEARMFGYAESDDRDAALAAVTAWQKEQQAIVDERHRKV